MCMRRFCCVRRRCCAILLLPLALIALILIILYGSEEDRMEDAGATSRIVDVRIIDGPTAMPRNADHRTTIIDPRTEEPRNVDLRIMNQKVLDGRNVIYRTTEPMIMIYREMYQSSTHSEIMEPIDKHSGNNIQKITEAKNGDLRNKAQNTSVPSDTYHSNKFQSSTKPNSKDGSIMNSRTTKVPQVPSKLGLVPPLDVHRRNHLDLSESSEPTVLERFIAKNARLQGIVPPRHPVKVRRDWQRVDASYDTFLFSAHLDDRPALDRARVRLMAVADTRANASALFCLLWYGSKNTPDVAYVERKSVGPDIRLSDGRVFGQYVLSCLVPGDARVPKDAGIIDANVSENARKHRDARVTGHGDPTELLGTRVPRNVSLVTSFNIHPSNVLEINIPLKPVHPSDVHDFGHCMSIVYWQGDPLRIVEWLELHRIWGVGEVNVYGNSLDAATLSVLRRYHRTGFVRFREVSTVVDEPGEWPILLNMSPVLNDCLYRNLYRFRHTVCTDFDEMIVPRGTHRTYRNMLDDALKNVQLSFPVKSFAFRNVYFFLDFGPVLPDPWYLTTSRYQTRISASRYGYSFKSITKTDDCLGLQNHYCWEPLDGSKDHPGWNVDVHVETGMNHHYKKCHFDRYLHQDGVCLRLMTTSFRDRTMERFIEELELRVPEVLVELGLVDWRPV